MTEAHAELVIRIVLPALIGILESVKEFTDSTLVSLGNLQKELDSEDAA